MDCEVFNFILQFFGLIKKKKKIVVDFFFIMVEIIKNGWRCNLFYLVDKFLLILFL